MSGADESARRRLSAVSRGVLYFGDPRGALALLDRGLDVRGVVHGRRGGPGWRALVPRLRGVPRWTLPDLEDAAILAALSALRPALLVAGFYPRRIPRQVLALAPGINVHPSDLPRWRGPDPTHWAIRAGDLRTAICVHWLTEGLDEGDVLRRVAVEIGPRETAGHLAERVEGQGAVLLAEVAASILDGSARAGVPQAGEVSWAPLPDPDALEIDWQQPASGVDRLVRASTPATRGVPGLGGAREYKAPSNPGQRRFLTRHDAEFSGSRYLSKGDMTCGLWDL